MLVGRRPVWDDGPVNIGEDDPDEGRAPIGPYCGVTALPAELSHVVDTDFICDNALGYRKERRADE